MAKILVSKATKSVDNLTELCINLGQQIPHEAQRNAFLGKALMIIQGQDVPVATETTSQPEAQKPAKVVAPIDKPQALKIIERELSLILGPLATSLVQRRSGTFQDIKELYTVLSQSIPNASERREFIEKVEAQLTPSKETVALFKPDGAPPAKTSTLNSSVVDTIAGELAIFLGPIAKTLVKREASLATSTEALIQRLKQHLSDPKEWDSFQRKLSTKIK